MRPAYSSTASSQLTISLRRSWVGLFSVLFLHRRLTRAQWVALGVIMLGVGIVGAASLIQDKNPATQPEAESADKGVSPLVGVGLVLLAQVFSACRPRFPPRHSADFSSRLQPRRSS